MLATDIGAREQGVGSRESGVGNVGAGLAKDSQPRQNTLVQNPPPPKPGVGEGFTAQTKHPGAEPAPTKAGSRGRIHSPDKTPWCKTRPYQSRESGIDIFF
ncbi:hypothetical protein H6G17_27465 [Chroococcidiopsis sp. FACHB-1243]|uniref:hypothetical protein n=1 Tax=Chroococcidiopsis sp. [FACHB-1243] TaxID=2692781 RepID=UPI0017838302|nr:hypothetical protein [Chroococcidiopsis sp. [FACHB-1243]]MBD2309202.1 hypothetical protein [Chroococcidiopsis sp. [FACHB-1243]]